MIYFLNGPSCAEGRLRPLTAFKLSFSFHDHSSYFSAMRSCQSSKFKDSSRVALTTNGGSFKAFILEPSKENDTGVTSRKSFSAGFDPTLHPMVTSGFPSMWKPDRSSSCISVAICLLLSLLLVLSTTGIGFHPLLHVFGLHDLVSRSFDIKGLHSDSSMTARLAVDPLSRTIVPESTATRLTRSSQVQFDNYSLILRGQRIFL